MPVVSILYVRVVCRHEESISSFKLDFLKGKLNSIHFTSITTLPGKGQVKGTAKGQCPKETLPLRSSLPGFLQQRLGKSPGGRKRHQEGPSCWSNFHLHGCYHYNSDSAWFLAAFLLCGGLAHCEYNVAKSACLHTSEKQPLLTKCFRNSGSSTCASLLPKTNSSLEYQLSECLHWEGQCCGAVG